MKIIQSFAKFEKGSPYDKKNKNAHLNFYSFLLSYLTLNKYYGHVTMICNQEAYDSFIKYIPYDEIIFLENKYDFVYWSAYKLDAIRSMSGDIIHVDTDVFIFDDLFRPFIDGNYDIIIQDIIKWHDGTLKVYVNQNADYLRNSGIIDANQYDNGFASCGVLGLKNHVKSRYFDIVDKTYHGMKNGFINGIDDKWFAMILEELNLYFTFYNSGYKVHSVLSPELIKEIGSQYVGNMSKYTHMWFSSKFDERNVELIKRKIRTEFPHYRKLIDKYDMEIAKH